MKKKRDRDSAARLCSLYRNPYDTVPQMPLRDFEQLYAKLPPWQDETLRDLLDASIAIMKRINDCGMYGPAEKAFSVAVKKALEKYT